MAYIIQDDIMGLPAIAATDGVQRAREGMLAHAVDGTRGGAEFIYLKGAAGTVAGSLVGYDQLNHTTTIGPPAAALSGAPLAVAMSANIAGQWGWYQVSGAALVAKDGTALAAGAPVGLGTVAGTVGAVTAGKQLLGAATLIAAGAGATSASVLLSRPHAQGAIT